MSTSTNELRYIPSITTATHIQYHNVGANEFYTKHDGTRIQVAPLEGDGNVKVSGEPIPYNYYSDPCGNQVQYVPTTRLYAPVDQTIPCYIDLPTADLEVMKKDIQLESTTKYESLMSSPSKGLSPTPLLSSLPSLNISYGVRQRLGRATECKECGLPVPRSQSEPSSLQHLESVVYGSDRR